MYNISPVLCVFTIQSMQNIKKNNNRGTNYSLWVHFVPDFPSGHSQTAVPWWTTHFASRLQPCVWHRDAAHGKMPNAWIKSQSFLPVLHFFITVVVRVSLGMGEVHKRWMSGIAIGLRKVKNCSKESFASSNVKSLLKSIELWISMVNIHLFVIT